MRFTEAKKGKSWLLIVVMIILITVLGITFCQFDPKPQRVQKTIIFEAD